MNKITLMVDRKMYQDDLEVCFGDAWMDVAHGDALREEGARWDDQESWDRAEYFAGWSESERLAWEERHAPVAESSPLPCGHISHENGGPADYSARCRQ